MGLHGWWRNAHAMLKREHRVRAPASDFSPAFLEVCRHPPHPLARRVMWSLFALATTVLVWSATGELDIVAVAEGKLVPASYVKIVQPAEQGIVRQILVGEGERVAEGQVLVRMDAVLAQADRKELEHDYHTRRLTLRRIDAELTGRPLVREPADPVDIFGQVQAQYLANRAAYDNQLAQQRATLDRARFDLAAAEQMQAKLEQVLPHYREQELAFDRLAKDGFAGKVLAGDKARERIEKEQELATQNHIIRAANATIAESREKLARVTADYVRALQGERAATLEEGEKLKQQLTKVQHREALLELKAPQAGVIKDLATHTPGTVVSPGAVLMTLVPRDERLRAEVWIKNDDSGFVRHGQEVKIKLAAFPFQKYGMLGGTVAHVGADAQESEGATRRSGHDYGSTGTLAYRALVDLSSQSLHVDGTGYGLVAGMQVAAEIKLGTRTVLEYLLSPVARAFQEAGRER